MPTRENFSKDIPTMNGSYYTGYKYSERVIVANVGFAFRNDKEYNDKIRKLANLLDVKSPSKLILGDEPDKYYYAVVDGDFDIEKQYGVGAKVEVTFICHNPLAYNQKWKAFTTDEKGRINIDNEGTADTYPIIEVDFTKDACFFQATNVKGETVLVGHPKDSFKPTQPLTDIIVNDDCSSQETFTSIAESLLDSKRKITGNYGVGVNGGAMICTNYNDNSEQGIWQGAGFKRSLNANIDEFEVEIDMIFSSEGKNYVVPPTPPTPPPSTGGSGLPTTNTYGTYKVVNCGGLWINATADISQPLYPMAPNTYIYPTEISNGWAKHTHSNAWNTFTGWSSMNYLQKVSDSILKSTPQADDEEFAEDEVGILEIYGYDKNGAKLFKMQITDSNEFYEYVEPQIYFGNTLVLDDGKTCPSARKIDIKDDSGKVTGQREVESGVFGDWNDLYGKMVVRREKGANGEYLWSANIYKYKNGQIVNAMSTSNSMSNSAFPKGDLNYLGFYIGKLSGKREVDIVAIENVKVRQLNYKKLQVDDSNFEIFKKKDHLQIDFSNGLVKLNNQIFLTSVDIGSEFFEIPTGKSQIAIKSDDTEAKVICGIQERFL